MTTLEFMSFQPGSGPVEACIDDDAAALRLSGPQVERRSRSGSPRGDGRNNASMPALFSATQPYRRPTPGQDPFDPAVGRWAAVVLRGDESDAKEALAPLLALRHAEGVAFDPHAATPGLLVIDRPAADKPFLWDEALHEAAGVEPHHLLLVGGPDRFPFEIVRAWSATRIIGVLDVADEPLGPLSWHAVRRYADKVCRWAGGQTALDRRALVYAFRTDTATRRSYDQLAIPLITYLSTQAAAGGPLAAPPLSLLGDEATTARLREILRVERPAIVLTCTHGIEYPADPGLWGALTSVNHDDPSGCPLSADVLPEDEPFAAGALVFAFACFSAGIPSRSALIELIEPGHVDPAETPRIAPLPRVLLGRAGGPLAFIGHVDRASTSSFAGFDGPRAFKDFADWILCQGGTVGQAMSTFWDEALSTAAGLAEVLDPRAGATPQQKVAAWVRHHDSMGWVVLGDPCVRPFSRGQIGSATLGSGA
jgi:hypothetical protein